MLALALLLAHTGAAAALWLAGLPAWIDIGLGVMILAAYLDACTRHLLRVHPRAVTSLTWVDARGPWRLSTRGGREYRADLRDDTWVHPGLMVLNFDLRPRGRVTVVLAADSLDADTSRRLRVGLRTGGRAGDLRRAPPPDP